MTNDLSFEYGENTDVATGCGAVLNGEMWVFGDHDSFNTQVNDFLNWEYWFLDEIKAYW